MKIVVSFLHLVAILACYFTSVQVYFQLCMMSIIIVFWLICHKCRKTPVMHLRYTSNLGWQVAMGRKVYQNAMILETTVITHVVVFLHFKVDDQPCSAMVIAKDSLSATDYRRLLVRLKLSGIEQYR